MRPLAALLLAAAAAGAAAPPPVPEGTDLVLHWGDQRLALRVEVLVDGRPPAAAWGDFLDKLFDHFDADRDGALSKGEVARLLPLPLPGDRELPFDFAKLDADGDGKVRRAELKAFCRRGGFTPVVVVVEPPAAEALRASAALFGQLDADGDGRLTRAELARARALLRKLDEDEDEALTLAEVLAPSRRAGPPAAPLSLRLGTPAPGLRPDGVLRLRLGKGARPAAGGGRRTASGARLTVAAPAPERSPFEATRAFYRAQFKTVLGDAASVGRKQLEDDPTAQALADVFAAADANDDGRLTLPEMEAFLDLVERGAGCQALVTVRDGGPDLFAALDADGDGRLDLRELNRAADVLLGEGGKTALKPDGVPRQLRVGGRRGAPGSAFGPLPLTARATPPVEAPAKAARGPGWFRAMDRNADGSLSPREFLGPPELFRKLDADGDGVISAAEAEKAEARKPKSP